MNNALPEALNSPRLAVVVPCFNEIESLEHAAKELLEVLSRLVEHGEISGESYVMFVDDGSSDQTWKAISDIHCRKDRVKGLKLSRNFGHQAALLAGLMESRSDCDAAISIDADLQQDPQVIPQFVAEFKRGADVVLGVRNDRKTDGWLKKYTATSFYSLMDMMGVHTVPNHADYRLLSRRALDALSLFPEPGIFLRATCLQLGFRVSEIYFDVSERVHGESKYSLRKMLQLAIHGITSFSVVPLRIVAAIGVALFVLSLIMGGYVAWRALVVGDTVPGWASTALPIYFIGGIQLLCLGVVGEYVGQIFTAVKHRPRWICEHKLD
jgi:glycosyltransferase involved in cell wall biosynthesis